MSLLQTTLVLLALVASAWASKATCSGNSGLAAVTPQEAAPKLQEEHSESSLLAEDEESDVPETWQPSKPLTASKTRAWHLPILTELPTPLPDLLVLVIAFASFYLFRKLQDALNDACDAEPVPRQTFRREETDEFGCTALHRAAFKGSGTEVRKLLEGRSDPNVREAWDETPLHMAARSGSIEASRLLVSAGTRIDAVNADDKTALVVAGENKQEAMCDFLMDHGATAGGLEDNELPKLLSTVMLQRLLKDLSKEDKDSSPVTN